MSNITINSEIIQWGLQRARLESHELKKAFPKIDSWIRGKEYPSFRKLEELAKKLHMPIGYFFLSQPPQEKLPIPFYRSCASSKDQRASVELIDTLYAMQRRVDWLSEFYQQNGYDKLDFIGSAKISDSPVDLANKLRSILNMEDNWAEACPSWNSALSKLFSSVEAAGIVIVANGVVGNNTHRKLSVEEFRGFVMVDDYAPLIFVNNADAKAAQMFTIAHELAHLLFGSAAIFDLECLQPAPDETELACDRVAAEFLVPTDSLKVAFEQRENKDIPYQELAKIFKVSEIVVARRLWDLKYIRREDFFAFYNEYKEASQIRESSPSGGNFYKNQDKRIGSTFMRAILDAVNQGSLTHINAFRLTGLHGGTFDKYAKIVEESV